MKNNKKLFLFGVIFVIIVIFIITTFSFILHILKDSIISQNMQDVKIYYYDKVNNTLSYETKKLKLEKEKFIYTIFNEMKNFAKSTNLVSAIPKNLEILDYSLIDYNLHINISNNYNSLEDTEKLIFRAGFIWTITETDFVNNVKIFVNGEEQKFSNTNEYLNRSNILLDPIISPDKIEREKAILYFATKDNKLVKESRNIQVRKNKSMELHILEELINGPKLKENVSIIPTETKIRNVKTEDNICYVDLSIDFITKLSNNKIQENLAIYSIVNSLTNLENIDKVQFLIDGEKINLSKDRIDISQPLGKNESIIQNKNIIGEKNN